MLTLGMIYEAQKRLKDVAPEPRTRHWRECVYQI